MADIIPIDVQRGNSLVAALERRRIAGDKLHPIHSADGLQLAGQLVQAARNAYRGLGRAEAERVFFKAITMIEAEFAAKQSQR